MDVHVHGADDLARVAAAVRRLGDDRTIVNEMTREIRKAGKPIRAAVKARAVAILPARGGLNRWVAALSVRVAVRRAASSAGVSVVGGRNSARRRSDVRRIDAGRVRAPAWGRRRARWHVQQVTPGFFTDAVGEDGVKAFRQATSDAIGSAIRKVGL